MKSNAPLAQQRKRALALRRYYPARILVRGEEGAKFFRAKFKKNLAFRYALEAEWRLNFEKRKLSELKPAEYNPRKALAPGDLEFERIVRSIDEFGYVDPIIINRDGTIIGGHQRCTVLQYLGYETADVVVVDLDKTKERACNIALNKITGEWDEEKLKDLLINLDESGFDLDATGFSSDELENIIAKVDGDLTANDDNYDADAAYKGVDVPITKPGDIWQLGRHRLMCGDATEERDVAALMRGEKADLIITDPPYNVAYGEKMEYLEQAGVACHTARASSHIANDDMGDEEFYTFLLSAYRAMNEAAKSGASIYVFHADTETVNFRTAMKAAGFKISECLIWEKNTFVLGRQDYHWRHEPVLYGWKEGAAHFFIKDRTQDTVMLDDPIDLEAKSKKELIAIIEQLTRAEANTTTVLFEDKPHRSELHPTMKPVELVGKLMTNSSKPGFNVLDSFGGSGTTLIAAEQLGRNAFLMEMDEKFCDVIIDRWEALTGEKAVLVNG